MFLFRDKDGAFRPGSQEEDVTRVAVDELEDVKLEYAWLLFV